MNKYELALVVSAKLDSEAIAATVQRAKDYIERFGGTIGEVEEWGKRKLAYEIQKQTEAYYFFINFEAESQAPAQLESVLRIMDNVLRYLVLAKDENDTFKVAPEKAPAAEEAMEAPAEEVPEAEEAPAAEEEAA
ncbi:MAG: 30S ribosomal protein S6, partial [Lachnospiraceae bacterium]|nr:30S ribosomal protein S6 [Lachnospiraceae bacterium]